MVTRALVGAGLLLWATACDAAAARARLGEVRRWAYQLQGTPRHLDAGIDCVVVDPDEDAGRFHDRDQVRRLQERPGRPDRLVLAYLSIGEAEDYRSYWQASWRRHPPAFIAPENPSWRGNFKVRYWLPEWQALVLAALDRIVAAGFDGVYLDVVDAFEYFEAGGPRFERNSAPRDMARLVERLAQQARDRGGRPGFLVVPQNGATLLERLADEDARDYLGAIDAVGVEDVFYEGRRRQNNPYHPQPALLALLARFATAGKLVLSIEYLSDADKVRQYRELARAHGFVPYVAPRSLNRIIDD